MPTEQATTTVRPSASVPTAIDGPTSFTLSRGMVGSAGPELAEPDQRGLGT